MSNRIPKTVPLSVYVAMLLSTHLGWTIGTLLYHWVVGK